MRLAVAIALAALSGCGRSTVSSGHGGASGAAGHGGASAGAGGHGGTTGTAGASGSIGTGTGGASGASGSGGASGASGTSGVGGTGAGGASAGAAGGTGGSAGAAGTGASAGTGALGGSGATGGVAGGGGAGGRVSCSLDWDLTCGTSALTLTNGHVTNFSPQEYSPMDGRYCNASGLTGTTFQYVGPPNSGSSSGVGVDAPAGNLRLSLTAGPGGYAGGGIYFRRCVTVPASNAIRFNAWRASGDQRGCTFKLLLQTFEQWPTTQNPPGGCGSGTSCYNFPASPNIALASTPTMVTVALGAFAGGVHAMPIEGQIVGLQWQLDSPAPVDAGAEAACTVEVRIDDIDFIGP